MYIRSYLKTNKYLWAFGRHFPIRRGFVYLNGWNRSSDILRTTCLFNGLLKEKKHSFNKVVHNRRQYNENLVATLSLCYFWLKEDKDLTRLIFYDFSAFFPTAIFFFSFIFFDYAIQWEVGFVTKSDDYCSLVIELIFLLTIRLRRKWNDTQPRKQKKFIQKWNQLNGGSFT